MNERKELAHELLIISMLMAIIAISSYMAIDALTGDRASEYLKSMNFVF